MAAVDRVSQLGVPGRPLTYAEFTFRPGDIRYNIAPAALRSGTCPVRQLAARTCRGRLLSCAQFRAALTGALWVERPPSRAVTLGT